MAALSTATGLLALLLIRVLAGLIAYLLLTGLILARLTLSLIALPALFLLGILSSLVRTLVLLIGHSAPQIG